MLTYTRSLARSQNLADIFFISHFLYLSAMPSLKFIIRSLKNTKVLFLVFFALTTKLSGQVSPIDSLMLRMEQTVEPYEKTDLLVQIIEFYRDTDNKRAMQYANWALRESENAGYETGKAKVLYNIGEINESDNLYDIAIGYYFSSL